MWRLVRTPTTEDSRGLFPYQLPLALHELLQIIFRKRGRGPHRTRFKLY